MTHNLNKILLILSLAIHGLTAFVPSYGVKRTTISLHGYIENDSTDEMIDPKAGGIGLAMDNAIVISGNVDKKGTAIAQEMKHYTKVRKTDLSSLGAKVICKGEGEELYKDPGLSVETIISLAPLSAVTDALNSIESADKTGKIFVNFAGGDDLMVHEVLAGVQQMVSGLEISSKVQFRSLCEPSFPMEKCGVVAVSVDGESEGQIYYNEGEWYTLSEDDINTDLE